MRLTFLLLSASMVSALHAGTTLRTQIHDIDHGDHISEQVLVFLASGQVARLSSPDPSLLAKLAEAQREQAWLEIELGAEREILSAAESMAPPRAKQLGEDGEDYVPSILPDLESANLIFGEASYKEKESQCYNRAHVWAYEWRVKRDLFTSKVWLSFTRKYIRRHNFGWWFHVAPLVHVTVDGKSSERVLDRKYTNGPKTLKQWTDFFLRDDAVCPLVRTYAEYANYPETGSCFIMKSSMYYYQPVDLEILDNTGMERTSWVEADLKGAYLDALDIAL